MPNPITVEPAIDPNNRITFLLDWELTMKCNLSCDYCAEHTYGGRDNSTSHPPIEQCLKTIDFMFKYVDLQMAHRPAGLKYVILNVYGGEALHHPDIVQILQTLHDKYQSYVGRWNLTVTTTTNAIVSKKKLTNIIPLIDEFTVSYHSGNTDKQKQEFKENLLAIKAAGKRLKCVVLMHQDAELFADSQNMIAWLNNNEIKHLPRQLDLLTENAVYNTQQVKWFDNLYKEKSRGNSIPIAVGDQGTNMSRQGRACCGGRQLCLDKNYKQRTFFINNKFTDWYCSVNHFFLYIKQLTGEIFFNKDCKMSFGGKIEPVGSLNNSDELLNWTQQRLLNKDMPVIQCKKSICLCGLCAPKAESLSDYQEIMKKYIT